VAQADEALKQIQARAEIIKNGARPQERKQLQATVDAAKTRAEAGKREKERMRGLGASEVNPMRRYEEVEEKQRVAEANYRQSLEQLKLLNLGASREDREAMESAVQQAENALGLARVSQQRVEATRLELQAATIAVEQAQASLELALTAETYCVVTAPTSGRIEELMAEVGSVIGSGAALALLVPPGRAEIVVRVMDSDRERIERGMAVTYELDALPGKGSFKGKVVQKAVVADAASGLFSIRIEPEAKEQERLKAGMFVRGFVEVGVKKNALLVPVPSVLRMEGRKVLFVVEGENAHKRYIETGLRYPDRVGIVGGLEAGELLVVDGQVGLVDGSPIQLKKGGEHPGDEGKSEAVAP